MSETTTNVEKTNETAGRRFEVGTLRYSLLRLLLVGASMLLATQSLALLCNHLIPGIAPVLMDRCGASAAQIALVIGTLPYVFNFVLNPIISTVSDKTRTRRGRRIPYLILSAPVMALLLVMIAWTPEIAGLLHRFVLPTVELGKLKLVTLGVLISLFMLVYLFPGSVVEYLIADVIPRECIGRYQAFTSLASTGLGFCFNKFILAVATEHTKPVLALCALLYLGVYILQFFVVREGKYPPVADRITGGASPARRAVEYVGLFFRQCFSRRIFIFLFISVGLNRASTICRVMFNVLFATKELGMSMAEYGDVMAYGALGSALVVLPLGKIMDRTHPIYLYFIGGIIIIITNVLGYFFVWGPKSFLILGISIPVVYAIQNLAWGPLGINLMPRDKYGQFCSAQAMVVSLTVSAGSLLGGKLIDRFGYRVIFVWDFVATALATLALLVVFYDWKRLGGRNNYQPPPTD